MLRFHYLPFRIQVSTSARTPYPRLRRAADGGAIMGSRVSERMPLCRILPSLLPSPSLLLFLHVKLFSFPARYHIDQHCQRRRLENVEDVYVLIDSISAKCSDFITYLSASKCSRPPARRTRDCDVRRTHTTRPIVQWAILIKRSSLRLYLLADFCDFFRRPCYLV